VRFSTAKPLPSLPAPTLFGWALAVAAVLAILILPRPFDLLAIPAVAAGPRSFAVEPVVVMHRESLPLIKPTWLMAHPVLLILSCTRNLKITLK